MRFLDRTDAGRRLAERVGSIGLRDPIVLALPRGGVPVAFEIATTFDVRLDVFVARKVGAPGHSEFGIGSVGEGGSTVTDTVACRALGVSAEQFEGLAAAERDELERRVARYRGDRPLPDVASRDVVLVDDGLATGVTAEAALHALRSRGPHRLVLAAPACAPEAAARLRAVADDVICLIEPAAFAAVGQWYDEFGQTSDAEVIELLERAGTPSASGR
jgi:putative phosphoribosyl transferase